MRILPPAALLTLACAGVGPARFAPTARVPDWLTEVHVASGGLDRTAYVHVPAVKGHQKLPLILIFHGGQGETGEDGLNLVPYWEQWANHGYVLAFPNGLTTTGANGTRAWAGPDDPRDFEFTNALIDRLVADDRVDPTKVYATGFSNGSGFAWMLECEDTDRFAGFGHVSLSMPGPVLAECHPTKRVPDIWFHGDADPKSQWDGGGLSLGVPRTMDWLLQAHGCDPAKARVSELPDSPEDDTSVTRTEYRGCADGAEVELFRIHNGQHRWPTTRPIARAPGQCRHVDAADETIRFWREYAGLPG